MPKWDNEEEPITPPPLPVTPPAAAGDTPAAPVEAAGSGGSTETPVESERPPAVHTSGPPEEQTEYLRSAEDDDTDSEAGEEVAEPLTHLEQSSDQRFDRPGTVRVGILGGTGVGKSYLFQAMVYRITDCGILHRYLRNSKPYIWGSFTSGGKPEPVSPVEFIKAYQAWRRLPSTTAATQRWYRVSLTFNTGLLGKQRWDMDVDFLDGSGEALETGLASPAMREVWDGAFKEATIMVFCLPIWVLFPNSEFMTDQDWEYRDLRLVGFDRLVATYGEIRNQKLNVRTILALTMADDDRSALRTLRRHWIEPCVDPTSAAQYLKQFKRPWGVPRYLASARETSEYLYRELDSVQNDGMVKNIYKSLIFGQGRPWLIPMSAVDGEELGKMESEWNAWKDQRRKTPPRARFSPNPAHVELPLLAAMVEWKNSLM